MAWTEHLPSGRWRGMYRDAGGVRRSAGTFTHKAAALREAAAKEVDARKHTRRNPNAGKQKWGVWREEWLSGRSVEATTAKADAGRIRVHLNPRWAEVPIASITRHDVKVWIRELEAQGVKAETRKRIVHLFSASLNAALDAEIIDFNPAARMGMAKGAQAQERFLTAEEYELIRAQLPTERDQLVADLLVNTGMRWSELAGLHRNRLDLKRGIVRIVETYSEAGHAIKAYPKGKQVREVPLTPELVEALRNLPTLARTGCGVEHASGAQCRSTLVLATDVKAAPLRNSKWSDIWRQAVADAGVGHTRIHDLRHTYASWLLQQGVPLAEVGRLMGHASTQTTAKYAHLAETPSAAVLAALAATRKPHARKAGHRNQA